jgi:hypothetical protein
MGWRRVLRFRVAWTWVKSRCVLGWSRAESRPPPTKKRVGLTFPMLTTCLGRAEGPGQSGVTCSKKSGVTCLERVVVMHHWPRRGSYNGVGGTGRGRGRIGAADESRSMHESRGTTTLIAGGRRLVWRGVRWKGSQREALHGVRWHGVRWESRHGRRLGRREICSLWLKRWDKDWRGAWEVMAGWRPLGLRRSKEGREKWFWLFFVKKTSQMIYKHHAFQVKWPYS